MGELGVFRFKFQAPGREGDAEGAEVGWFSRRGAEAQRAGRLVGVANDVS